MDLHKSNSTQWVMAVEAALDSDEEDPTQWVSVSPLVCSINMTFHLRSFT